MLWIMISSFSCHVIIMMIFFGLMSRLRERIVRIVHFGGGGGEGLQWTGSEPLTLLFHLDHSSSAPLGN